MKRNIQVAALHDIAGLGRCSMTMAIPVLSAMGILTCPIPTSVFSAHSQYPNFVKQELSDFLRETLLAYRRDGVRFDAVYSGYLGDAGQIDTVRDFLREQTGLRVVDPVFADQGLLYPSITLEMVAGMRRLIAKADIITPNLTEAAFLLGRAPTGDLPAKQEEAWLAALHAMGPRNVLITSCRRAGEEDTIAVLGRDEAGDIFRVRSPLLPAQFHGNGDLFGSVLVGGILNGLSLREASRQAAGFIYEAMLETIAAGTPILEGVRIERSLRLLIDPPTYAQIRVEEVRDL